MHEQIKPDLCVRIARSRGGHKAGKLAKQLLESYGLSELLVGLIPKGDALVYIRSMWSLSRMKLPNDGRVEPVDGEHIEGLQSIRMF